MKVKDYVTVILVVLLAVSWGLGSTTKVFTTSGQITEGDYWTFVEIYNDTTVVDMYGGRADFIYTYDGSTLNAMGGTAEVGALDYSTINITGGEIGYAYAWDTGIINFYGSSSTSALRARHSGTINLISGTVDAMSAEETSMLNLHGGNVTSHVYAIGSSTVNVFGRNLTKTNTGGAYGHGQVTGDWMDGLPFVVDLKGADTYLHVNLITVVDINIKLRPKTLNLTSTGRWVSCEILIPDGYSATDVNSASICLEGELTPEWIWFNEKQNVLMAKFTRSELEGIMEPGEVELTVTGYLTDGSYFVGTDTVKVIGKGRRKD